MASELILTITIPTYNRPKNVLNTIQSLLPQLNENVCILVLDNCSDIDIKIFLQQEIKDFNSYSNITVVRNAVNIGPDANFARCFELSNSIYAWTLSDDDKVENNAIEIILNEINAYKEYDLIGFNFNSNCNRVPRNTPIVIKNITDMAYKVDFFGNWLFMSTAVYKVNEYLKHIRFAIWSAYTMSSQIVPAMMAISQGKVFILSEKTIADNVPLEDLTQKWSDIQISLGLSILLEVPVGFKKDEYLAFGKKLIYQLVWPADVLYSILKSINLNIDKIDNYHIYVYKQNFLRTLEFRDQLLHQKFQYYVGLFLIINKAIFKIVLKIVPRFERKSQIALPFNLFIR